MIIKMVRHGETTFNRRGLIQGHSQESALTELGKAQIYELVKNIGEEVFDCIYVSDLRRTIESWEIFRRAITSREVIFTPQLREQGQGLLEGCPYSHQDFQLIKQLELQNDSKYKELSYKYNTETITSFRTRINTFFQTIPSHNKILLITHGGVIGLKTLETNIKNAGIYTINH